TSSFLHNLTSHPFGASDAAGKVSEVIRGWINNSTTSPGCKLQRDKCWKAFRGWRTLWIRFKKIDERRMERQLGEASKKLLTLPPKKRRPPDISSLLHFHNTSMHDLLDFSSFPIFPNRISKKQTELFNVVQPSVLVGPHQADLTGGYLGKPMHNIEAPKEKRVTGVGFGGVMLTKEKSDTWMASAVTVEESDVLVVSPKIFKEVFLKDHRNKYVLAKRTKELSAMPVFKLLMPSHLHKLSQDFKNGSYVAKSNIVEVGDALTKVVVVAGGEVDVTAKVEDPRSPGRVLDVTVARLGKGGIIGDVELIYSKSIFTLKATAATAAVETFEISRENFGTHIFENNHAEAARDKLVKSVEEKVAFNSKRVKEEMLKFAHF
ncbi:hypothetical protein TrRE_jg2064, partial [Triparma retinervis]